MNFIPNEFKDFILPDSFLKDRSYDDRIALKALQDYVKIKTVGDNYHLCLNMLSGFIKYSGLLDNSNVTLHRFTPISEPSQEFLAIHVNGTDDDSKHIVLNSHSDVVPEGNKNEWNFPPFDGIIEGEWIHGRGTQDDKCLTIYHILSLVKLDKAGKLPLKKSILVLITPDEERGGHLGMDKVVGALIEKWPVYVALDEGLANPTNKVTVFNGERAVWWVRIVANGPQGHGSRLVKGTAVERLLNVVNKVSKFREAQSIMMDLHQHEPDSVHACRTLGDALSVNITHLEAGLSTAVNVVPSKATASMDFRLPIGINHEKMEGIIKKWCDESSGDGGRVEYTFVQHGGDVPSSSTDSDNWTAITNALKEMDIDYTRETFSAGTDGRYFRQNNLPCYGFTPLKNTPILLHCTNEKLEIQEFLNGIPIMTKVIENLAKM